MPELLITFMDMSSLDKKDNVGSKTGEGLGLINADAGGVGNSFDEGKIRLRLAIR